MSRRARVKDEPGSAAGLDQVCIKQEPELNDAEWVHDEAVGGNSEDGWGNSEDGWGNSDPNLAAGLQQETMLLQQAIIKAEPIVKEEPEWMCGGAAGLGAGFKQEVAAGPDGGAAGPGAGFRHEVPVVPGPPPAAVRDVKPNSLVRDCWVQLERCLIPPGALKHRTRITATATATAPPPPSHPYVSEEREREVALRQLSDLLIKAKPRFRKQSNLITHKLIRMKKNYGLEYKSRSGNKAMFTLRERGAEVPARFPLTRYDPAPSRVSYLCEVCKQVFTDLDSLKVHALVHASFYKLTHVCDICDKTCAGSLDLQRHKLFHAESRPYPCHVCKKRYFRKCDLSRHLLSHKSGRVQCAACEARQALQLLGGLMRPHEFGPLDGDTERCDACKRTQTVNSQIL